MNKRKAHSAKEGIVASANLDTVFTRQIFFAVDPTTLAHLDEAEIREKFPKGNFMEFDPLPLLNYVPELEAEIFYLVHERNKNQKDVAVLLGLSQPTVSYRYRRVLEKLAYLVVLVSLNVRELVDQMIFMNDQERNMLYDLFFTVNQEMVGRKYGKKQSSVKWAFTKAKTRLEEMERQAPEKWAHHLCLMIYLEENLDIRVLH